jgi:hypothetical protein
MMQARTSPFLRLPVMLCLPVRFRGLTTSQYLTHRDSLLTREITRAPLIFAQRCFGADVPARYARMAGLGPMA